MFCPGHPHQHKLLFFPVHPSSPPEVSPPSSPLAPPKHTTNPPNPKKNFSNQQEKVPRNSNADPQPNINDKPTLVN
ncbi:hypothetical protein ACX0FE_16355, partial [Enterococcus faecium]